MNDFTKKEYNTYLLLNLIRANGPISRTQLQEITELRPATISLITKELLDSGLIKTEGSTNMGRGRNHLLLSINTNFLCVVCATIEVSEITIIISTLSGKIIDTVRKDISSYTNTQKIIDMMVDVIRELMQKYPDKKFLGIGVGDPGLLDITGEFSLFSSQLRLWKNIPLKSILTNAFNLPVRLEVNDRLKALGEKVFGLAKKVDHFIYVQLGQGIGISAVTNGLLIRGYNGTAGEMGHTHVINNNKMCSCGSYGCLETIASLDSIISQVTDAIKNGAFSYIRDFVADTGNITYDDIVKAVKMNDKVCLNVVENAGTHIGIALANAINILNPQLIILGGPMCHLGSALIDPLKSAVYKNSLSLATSGLSFELSELGDDAAPLGAITMIMNDFFKTESFGLKLPKMEK